MRYLSILFVIVAAFSSCKQESNRIPIKSNYKLSYSFLVDGKHTIGKNSLVILRSQDGDTVFKTKNSKNVRIPSGVNFDSRYDVYFIIDNCKLKFDDVLGKAIVPNQNTNWIIGIDNKPFDNSLSLVSEEEYSSKTLKRIYYWQFNVLDHGDGVMLIRKE